MRSRKGSSKTFHIFVSSFFSRYLISDELCFPQKHEPMFIEVKEAAYTSRGGNLKLERPAPAILQGLRGKEARCQAQQSG